jgi:hypothetical protein
VITQRLSRGLDVLLDEPVCHRAVPVAKRHHQVAVVAAGQRAAEQVWSRLRELFPGA